jgi:hypothetical protein
MFVHWGGMIIETQTTFTFDQVWAWIKPSSPGPKLNGMSNLMELSKKKCIGRRRALKLTDLAIGVYEIVFAFGAAFGHVPQLADSQACRNVVGCLKLVPRLSIPHPTARPVRAPRLLI